MTCFNIYLQKQDNCELRIDLTYKDKSYSAKYSSFYLTNEADKYRLKVAGYSGTAGDSLIYPPYHQYTISNNMQFSTPDSDNDRWTPSCAAAYNSGWWFNMCFGGNLNGEWGKSTGRIEKGYIKGYGQFAMTRGLPWYTLTGWYSVATSEMKIRLKGNKINFLTSYNVLIFS